MSWADHRYKLAGGGGVAQIGGMPLDGIHLQCLHEPADGMNLAQLVTKSCKAMTAEKASRPGNEHPLYRGKSGQFALSSEIAIGEKDQWIAKAELSQRTLAIAPGRNTLAITPSCRRLRC
jgi:hypothetical protein